MEARAALRSSESRALALAKEVERRCDPEEVENLKKQVTGRLAL